MSYHIANRRMARVQDMIDDLPDAEKDKVEAALDALEKNPFDPTNPPQSIDATRYKIFTADGNVEIVFEMPLSSSRINIEAIRPRSKVNRLLKAIKQALVFHPHSAAPK